MGDTTATLPDLPRPDARVTFHLSQAYGLSVGTALYTMESVLAYVAELQRNAQQPAQAAPVPCDAIPKHQWEVLSCEPNEYEPTMESGWQRCKVCGTRAHFNRDLLREADAALEAASA